MTAPSKPNFDRIARPYRILERFTFGGALHRARLHFLPQLHSHKRALILGDGDGRFTAALLAANPHIHADAVDVSSTMLRMLTARTQGAHPTAAFRLRTYAADALTLDLPDARTYDLVVSHFFLDCFRQAELERLVVRIRPHLAPDSTWVLSDFRIPPAGLLRLPARILLRALYFGFRVLTGLRTTRLPDYAAALAGIGLSRRAVHRSLGGILTSEMWQVTTALSPSERFRSTLHPMLPPQRLRTAAETRDPVPDPEPASPSLPEPDPGVFHHDPAPPATKPPSDK